MPMVHWAVVESTPGGMTAMGRIAQETVGPQSAREAGTYALYGGVDAQNPDVMRLLEIYESYEAYRIHSTSEAFQAYRACGDGSLDVKERHIIGSKALEIRHFSAFDCFEMVEWTNALR